LEKKQVYEKPLLRKVRLEAKTSVLATCNTSTFTQPRDVPVLGAGCGPLANNCFTPNL
jgi:hypothetical protein